MTSIRPERLAIPAIAVVLAWWYLLNGAGMPAAMAGMPAMREEPSMMTLAVMWGVMMTAMMLPSAALWIAERGTPFAAGYVLVWVAFGGLAGLLQWNLAHAGALSDAMALRSVPFAAIVLAGVIVYELTPFKRACLRRCHSDDRVREQASGAGLGANLACGVRQGIVCVGCCWALMALLFVAGVMNIVWIAAITLFVTAQKLLPLRAA